MIPCQCEDRSRNPYTLSDPSDDQLAWTLIEWQSHLTQLYGEKNLEQGIHFVIGRLSSERRELNSLESMIQEAPESIGIETAKREFQLELADTLAWTIGAASVIGVNVQNAVVHRYGLGCSICKLKPCNCPQGAHNFKAFNGKSYKDVANGAPF